MTKIIVPSGRPERVYDRPLGVMDEKRIPMPGAAAGLVAGDPPFGRPALKPIDPSPSSHLDDPRNYGDNQLLYISDVLRQILVVLSQQFGQRPIRTVEEHDILTNGSFTLTLREIPERWVIWSRLTGTATDTIRVAEGASVYVSGANVAGVFEMYAGRKMILTATDKQITVLNPSGNTVHVFIASLAGGQFDISGV